jgi:hypothetical protein
VHVSEPRKVDAAPSGIRLQFHHDDPFGLGGDRSADNLRLLCQPHNLYMAEKDYRKELVDCYRRSADRVREPSPSFELRRTEPVVNWPATLEH